MGRTGTAMVPIRRVSSLEQELDMKTLLLHEVPPFFLDSSLDE
jgi:hypothetical protein